MAEVSQVTVPRDPPTLEQVLQRFLARDEEHHTAWQAVTTTQKDQQRLLEAMQVDIQRMTRVMEKQDGINERQIKLQETSQTHGETFSRAFSDMKDIRSEFSSALREFSSTFQNWKKDHEIDNAHVAKSVSAYNGGLKLGSTVLGLILLLVGVVATSWRNEIITRADKVDADFERRKLSIDLRLDTLSQQVQEVRLSRQRDMEEKDKK